MKSILSFDKFALLEMDIDSKTDNTMRRLTPDLLNTAKRYEKDLQKAGCTVIYNHVYNEDEHRKSRTEAIEKVKAEQENKFNPKAYGMAKWTRPNDIMQSFFIVGPLDACKKVLGEHTYGRDFKYNYLENPQEGWAVLDVSNNPENGGGLFMSTEGDVFYQKDIWDIMKNG